MSQLVYRGNLSAKSFPFVSENFGQSVIVKGNDNNFNRQLTSAEDNDKDIGLPQFYYCHNVMPHPEGLQSIGYTTVLNGGLSGFTSVTVIRDAGDNKTFLGITAAGAFYILIGGVWVLKGSSAPGALVTFAFVSGITYIYLRNAGCVYYDFGTQAFIPVVLAGLTVAGPGATIGICASAGYMIAWNSTTVAWSSTISPIDFVPSLITGAGGGSVEGAKGSINFCVPHLLGFIVYTASNAVAALYSGNTRFPYNFREIVASGGLASLDLIAADANTGNHYAYTTSGFQLVSTSGAQTVYPEMTDFIAGKLFEDFDVTTNTFSTVALSSTMLKKLTVVSDRYMVISYGITSFTHAIVYDLIQKRYGKLKIPHAYIFEYTIPAPGITEIPRQSIAILQDDGSIKLVDFAVASSTSDGVLLLGKFQYVRTRMLQLEQIVVENVRPGSVFSVTDMYTLDGKTYKQSVPTLVLNSGLLRKYGCRITGANHSILLKGAFEACSFELTFNLHGRR